MSKDSQARQLDWSPPPPPCPQGALNGPGAPQPPSNEDSPQESTKALNGAAVHIFADASGTYAEPGSVSVTVSPSSTGPDTEGSHTQAGEQLFPDNKVAVNGVGRQLPTAKQGAGGGGDPEHGNVNAASNAGTLDA